MADDQVSVTFQPSGRTVRVSPGTRLMEAAAEAGAVLDLPCGGEGVCGKCRVRVRQGGQEPSSADRSRLDPGQLEQGFRLACQTPVLGPMVVEVPETSLLASYHQVMASFESTTGHEGDPVVWKRYVELPPPDREHDAPDCARLEQAVGPLEVELHLLRRLSAELRRAEFRGTLVLDASRGKQAVRLADFEPGDTQRQCYGVAVDVGTTTLAALLLDLADGEELAVASRLNPQTGMGDDVLTRILYCQRNAQGLDELRGTVIAAVNEMIGQMVAEAGVDRQRIYLITFSGNTTMQQLLAGIDPQPLGEVPFVPALARRVVASAASLGLAIHPSASAYVLPVIGGFVGGDTVAGILATEMEAFSGPTLLVDIGTNGEIVLWAGGKLLAASTAAGPAFEGARISQGMRGSAGAIERVAMDETLRIDVIGGGRPAGLCGSGLIDLVAEMLRCGLLSCEGRMLAAEDLPGDLPPDLRRRAVTVAGRLAFLLADESQTCTGRALVFTQRDVRELQLASGAIRAGINILLQHAGLNSTDLEAVLIAGGFGNYIRRSNAQRIGLLPPDIPQDRIRYQGNTSLAGARLVALSAAARDKAESLASRTEHVDLSRDPNFRWAFAEAMIFPK